MKYRVSHSFSIASISASTAVHSRPAARLMRLIRLSGRNRENLASKAVTHPTAARSKAAAWASFAAYCTSHVVPSAGNASLRNGAAAPAGTAGGGRCDWATTAMQFGSYQENFAPSVTTRARG